LRMGSTLKKTQGRSGTRIPCEIPITLTSSDPSDPFSEPCQIILVNLRGCAALFSRSLEVGSAVRLQGLPAVRDVTARVVNCISFGDIEKRCLLGLSLDVPWNVWGIHTPPADWFV
jgi:hypothetical protein